MTSRASFVAPQVALFRQVPLRVSVKFPHFSAGLARIALKTSVLASTRFRVERGVILRSLMTGRREWRQST